MGIFQFNNEACMGFVVRNKEEADPLEEEVGLMRFVVQSKKALVWVKGKSVAEYNVRV
jgi:hypothetical protein